MTIPNSITGIGYQAFASCTSLATLNYNAVHCDVLNIYWLDGCTALTKINIGENVEVIPARCFAGCNSLTGTITIPNSVTSIRDSAFSGCTGLNKLDLGSGLTSIGLRAFYNCSHIDTIFSRNATPASVADIDAFHNVWKGLPLMVPAGSRDLYATAYAWRDFTNIIDEGNVGIKDMEGEDFTATVIGHRLVVNKINGTELTIAEVSGRIIYSGKATSTFALDLPASGIYMVRMGDRPAKRIAVMR